MIKAIIFDLGNVIVNVEHFIFCKRLEGVSTYTAEDIYASTFLNKIVKDYEEGRISSLEFYNEICYQLRIHIDFEEFEQMWNDIFGENEEVSALIRALKKHYRLFLLSNTNELHFNFIRKEFPVISEFDVFFLSYKLHTSKPSPRIFQVALKKITCTPQEVLYIDDIEEYTAAAARLGINAINFKNTAQLKQELINHKIHWEEQEPELPPYFY